MSAQPAGETRQDRWLRRRVTIPTMLGITLVATFGMPILLPGLAAWDVIRGRQRLPTVRAYLFLTQYAVNDSLEILAAGALWIAAGFGTTLGSERSQRRHERIQEWSIDVLARRADRLLGITVDTPDDLRTILAPGPVIVVSRHVSLFDASLPSLLCQQVGMHTRGVIMAELLADPGFDLLYQRLGSVFIARDNDPGAAALAGQVARQLDYRRAAVIFPEGRLARPDGIAKRLERLAEIDPQRAERLSSLRHVLPPRPGGLDALLDAAPDADVVVINHAGLDHYPSFRDVVDGAPLDLRVAVSVRRIARSTIPDGLEARTEWLDHTWIDVDDWVDERLS